jgi:alkyl sulfatase BDS1-like metallo-beta-lactamase superfamily hydrolase
MHALRAIAIVGAALVVAACSRGPAVGGSTSSDDVTPATAKANAQVAQAYDLADPQSFEDARRGFVARPVGNVVNAAGDVIWDYDGFAFVDGKAPATVNPSLWRQALLNNQVGLFKVADGIYQLRGFDLANITLIEGKTGWIVVDTLTSRETATAAMAFARKQLGAKPVTGLIFTHSHVDHFGGALGVVSAAEVVERHIPVVAPVGFMEEATSENVLVGPAMGRRAMYMYGVRLDRSARGLVDDGLGKTVAFGSVGILEPSVTVAKSGQEETIDGVRFVFQNVPGSEAPAELTFQLPEKKAYCGAEMLSQTMHNLYTLRGAKVRDALKWAQYIDEGIAQLGDTEVYFGQHHWPLWGHQRIVDFMERQRDVYRYTHDQTVRMINAGMTSREIAETIRLPKSLDAFMNVHGYYGTLKHNAKAVYQFYMGWFDGNPANLDPLPPQEAGKRYVELAGGAGKVLAAAQAAYDGGDYRWAAELLNHLVFAEPGNDNAKALLARTYSQLGYVAESAPWRNFYLTGAYELQQGRPKVGVTPAMLIDMLAHAPVERFLEAMAGGLNGPSADGKDLKVNLSFSDLGVNYVLHVKNAVLHFRKTAPAADANATLTLTKPIFLKMMTGTAGVKDTLLSDDLKVDGSKIDLLRFFALIDKAPGTFPIVTPR